MKINPLDIFILFFVFSISLISYRGGFLKNAGQTINLIISIIIINLINNNISSMFPFFNKTNIFLYLFSFFLILIILMLVIGFLIEFLIEQIEDLEITKSADIVLALIAGIIKGFVIFSILIFIFDFVPLSIESKDTVIKKVEKETYLFKPCNNLKNILLNN